MSEREVVITGTGLLSPIGGDVGENWDSVMALKTGIAHYPADGLPEFFQYAGKVHRYELPEDIAPKQKGQMKFLNRGAVLGFCSACEAVSAIKEDISEIPLGRRALYVAAGDFTKVGYDFMYPAIKDASDKYWQSIDHEKLNSAVLSKVTPFFLLETLNNNLFSFLSAYVQFMGPNTSLSSLSPCGGNALELAYRSIKQNRADVALAVGYGNWITEISLYEIEGLGILSKCRFGAHSYKPFDRHRDGFIPGEGGAAILLESMESAKRRKARVLGKVKAVGNSIEFTSNNKMKVPPQVSRNNILSVMRDAECDMGDLAFIIPHGSGTRKGDHSELSSIQDALGSRRTDVPICGLKPYTGHVGAASDLAEVIFGIHAVKEKVVPATLNFTETEKEFSDLKISGSPQECRKEHFLSISYGVGGQSSSVVVEVM